MGKDVCTAGMQEADCEVQHKLVCAAYARIVSETTRPSFGRVRRNFPQRGNTAMNVVKIEVPAGTRHFTGAAAQQGGLVGAEIK